MDLPGIQPLVPKFVGLGKVEAGTACENCSWFTSLEDEDGTCSAVLRKKKPAHVHPKGCCCRWMEKSKLPPEDPDNKD
jgi:hypothetical protein